ncbi:hypothetical protein [Microcystis aeruginosa]|uniref:hypothetical protein n=1 Tax=Microcystis aeruginosa TaxID=1126 RepID=UPI00084A22E5|nr:hypothetical protein [Microcystis aeruginosa]
MQELDNTVIEALASIQENFVEIQLSWGARKVTLGERTTSVLDNARNLKQVDLLNQESLA